MISVTRLPSAPCSCGARTLTGTRARTFKVSGSTARCRQKRRNAPVTVASTTSLSVPPSTFLTALKSATDIAVQSKRRDGPTSLLMGSNEAGRNVGERLRQAPTQLVEQQARLARVRSRRPRHRFARLRVGIGLHDHRDQVGAG